jgi:biotin carboxylase
MPRVLILATTTGYQTHSFGEAAERLGVELVFATDRCKSLDDPWRDGAVPIRFYDEAASVATIVDAARSRPIDGVLAVGDRPAVIAARVARALGLPGHSPEAAAAAGNKLLTRERLRAAGMNVPWFRTLSIDDDDPRAIDAIAAEAPYPCVIKPIALSASRGVMRADDPQALRNAYARLQQLLETPEVRVERNEAHGTALVESFIPGREFAVEGVLHHGRLNVFAIFDKPDPLDGPFFEETIYSTPSARPESEQQAIVDAIVRAAQALGLEHGPIHAECRVNKDGVFVLEVAARPIGGLCARVLRVCKNDSRLHCSYEEFLLRHAMGEKPDLWTREPLAAGVMMIPIPRRGIFRHADGVEDARAVDGVEEVAITAKPDQLLQPLPEGASYLGFIFARAQDPPSVDRALRTAHARLRLAIDSEWPVVQSRHG